MRSPKISVIMAAYNSEKFIAEAIKSVLNQTLKDWELIVINGRSADKTLSITERYSKKDPRIKIINQEKNTGPAAGWNLGIKKAKGKYIAILDSDDIALPKRLEIEYKYLEKNKRTFLIGSSFEFIDEKGRVLGKKINKHNKIVTTKNILYDFLILHPSVMFRRKPQFFYNKNWHPTEDLDLCLRMIKKRKKLEVIPNLLAGYRIHKDAVTSKESWEEEQKRRKLIALYCGEAKNSSKKQERNLKNKKDANKVANERKRWAKTNVLSELYEKGSKMKEYRKMLKKSIKRDGFLFWKREIFYYFASFFPKKFKNKVKKLLSQAKQ